MAGIQHLTSAVFSLQVSVSEVTSGEKVSGILGSALCKAWHVLLDWRLEQGIDSFH